MLIVKSIEEVGDEVVVVYEMTGNTPKIVRKAAKIALKKENKKLTPTNIEAKMKELVIDALKAAAKDMKDKPDVEV